MELKSEQISRLSRQIVIERSFTVTFLIERSETDSKIQGACCQRAPRGQHHARIR